MKNLSFQSVSINLNMNAINLQPAKDKKMGNAALLKQKSLKIVSKNTRKMENNKPKAPKINSILAITSIFAVLIAAFFIWQNNELKKLLAINSFEECTKAKGSQIQTTEPPKCITKDGREFEGPRKEEAKEDIWEKYGSQNFSFIYPAGVKIKEENKTISLIYLGKTQKEETELYDGYSFSISQTENASNLLSLAKKERQTSLEVCNNQEKVSEIEEIEVAQIKGYQYTSNCTIKTTKIYLQNLKKVYRITTTWAGDEKYKEILDKILVSLTFAQE